ncbi:hypothetical protein B0H12DRAFT_1236562 [Mycena haematopus]|nr:hypothetical protein B0H12DRAFT_1236539 [Mycena haematopus]KAJ7243135.1 hypothetical protein B0H12DRAFT_1236562 [Mycena haematopus]
MSKIESLSMAETVYITLGFPVKGQRKHTKLLGSYPARTAFVFKVQDTVHAAELLSAQRTYLDPLKHLFPADASQGQELEVLARHVYDTIPQTVIAQALYPIATGAIVPMVLMYFSDVKPLFNKACTWRRVECLRDALVYMILGGNDSSIATLKLVPVVRKKHASPKESTSATAPIATTPRKPVLSGKLIGSGNDPTLPAEKTALGICPSDGDQNNGKAATDHRSSPGAPHRKVQTIVSRAESSELESEFDSEPCESESDSEPCESDMLAPSHTEGSLVLADSDVAEDSLDAKYNHRFLGSFNSVEDFARTIAEGPDNGCTIHLLVMPRKSLIPMLNRLTLLGLVALIDGPDGVPVIRVFFGRALPPINRAYSVHVKKEIPMTGVDREIEEALVNCDVWDIISYGR